MAVDGDARQVVPDYFIDVVEVHLVQLLWFLFDADSDGLSRAAGFILGPFSWFSGQWACARDGVSRRSSGQAVGWREWRFVCWPVVGGGWLG